MKQYLLSVIHSGHDAIPAGMDIEQLFADVATFNQRMEAEGRMVFAGGLQPSNTAAVADGEAGTLTDGPVHDIQPCQNGMWIVLARDMDEAKELALEASRCCHVRVEVRPFEEMPEED